jgi:hypothetical protein
MNVFEVKGLSPKSQIISEWEFDYYCALRIFMRQFDFSFILGIEKNRNLYMNSQRHADRKEERRFRI